MRAPPPLVKTALACKCPRCGEGGLYATLFDLKLRAQCPVCGLDLAKNDAADGPAVFLIFMLGLLLVPLALLVDHLVGPPLWAHLILWGIIGLGLIMISLKPLKAYIIALLYKHRPWDQS